MKVSRVVLAAAASAAVVVSGVAVSRAFVPASIEYRVLATSKTSTMEKELNDASELGFRFAAVMGGETAIGGKEVVIVVARTAGVRPRCSYKLLATSRTSTMQKELQQAADDGFEFVGQTVFETLFGGREVVSILERDRDHPAVGFEYRLLATSRTSTMQKELNEVGDVGFEVVGMAVGKTAMGGNELVTITRRKR